MSCGWMSGSVNATAPPRSTGSLGPMIRSPGTVFRPSSAYAVISCSCAAIASMPIADR